MSYDVTGFDTDFSGACNAEVFALGGKKSFDSLDKAVCFVMEEVPESRRSTVMIHSNQGDGMANFNEIEAHYHRLKGVNSVRRV